MRRTFVPILVNAMGRRLYPRQNPARRRHRRRQRGQIVIVLALMLPLFVAVMGLGIDISRAEATSINDLQIADAVALASAQVWVTDGGTTPATCCTGSATSTSDTMYTTAQQVASLNGLSVQIPGCSSATTGTTNGVTWSQLTMYDNNSCSAAAFKIDVLVGCNALPCLSSSLIPQCQSDPYRCVTVVITHDVANLFERAAGISTTTVGTTVTAFATESGTGVPVLVG